MHQGLALISVVGFALRWYGTMIRFHFVRRRLVRVAPHLIDTLFLASGVLMIWNLGRIPVSTAWLLAKLSGLLLYIVLGILAMRSAPQLRRSLPAFIAALAVFAWIVSVAVSKSPWGFLR